MPGPTLDPGQGGGAPGAGPDGAPGLYRLLLAAIAAATGGPPPARMLAQPGLGREATEAPLRDEWSAPPPNPAYPFPPPVYRMPNMPYDPSTGTYRPTWGNSLPPDMPLPPGVGPDDPLRGRGGMVGAPWLVPAPLPSADPSGHIPGYGDRGPGPPQPVPPIGSRDPRAWAQWEADMRRWRAGYNVY